jgi:hypothetical protein
VVERFINLLLEYNEWVIEQPAEKIEDKHRIHLGVLCSFQEMAHQVHQWDQTEANDQPTTDVDYFVVLVVVPELYSYRYVSRKDKEVCVVNNEEGGVIGPSSDP